jgi:hypothetical protein
MALPRVDPFMDPPRMDPPRMDPLRMDSLRKEPRFQEIYRELNFPS